MGWGQGNAVIDFLRGINAGAAPADPTLDLSTPEGRLERARQMVAAKEAESIGDALNILDYLYPPPDSMDPGRSGSAAAMLSANASMMNAQENQRQGAYDRVSDRLKLLQATDELLDARRENAMAALIQAAPLLVAPGQEFTPGFEPGGPAMQLSNLIGGNLQPQKMVTAPLPLGDFVNEPRSVTPEIVNRDLMALMGG